MAWVEKRTRNNKQAVTRVSNAYGMCIFYKHGYVSLVY